MRKYYNGLKHPLLLLIVGALISSYIIPFYTRQWQDHQKELELKTELIGKISDAVTTIVIKTQTTKAIVNTPYKEFYDAYQTWESASAIIASKIRAYFYNSPMTDQWNNYSMIMTDFAFLSISDNTCNRVGYVQEIQKYFSVNIAAINQTELNSCKNKFDHFQKIYNTTLTANLDGVDWNELITSGNQTHLTKSWLILKQEILNQKDRLIQEILKSHILVFS